MDNSRLEIEIHAVLGRVAKLTRVNTDAALAEALGTSRQVLSGWKKRGTIPFDRLCELAIERDLSLDYILISLLNSMSYYIQAQGVRDTAQKKPETFNPDEAERFAKQLERSAEDEKQALETRVLQGQSTHQAIEGRGHQVAGRDFQNHGNNNDGRGGKK